MPDRTITSLSYAVGALFAVYIAFMGTAVYFAAMANGYSATVRELETEVAVLETEYYAALAKVSGTDAVLAGYTSPLSVVYVAKGGEPTLTRADR